MSNGYTAIEATLIIFIFDSMNNMRSSSNLNDSDSMNSLRNDLNNLNGEGIGMSNIGNRKTGNLGNGMGNGMVNVGGINGGKQEKNIPMQMIHLNPSRAHQTTIGILFDTSDSLGNTIPMYSYDHEALRLSFTDVILRLDLAVSDSPE